MAARDAAGAEVALRDHLAAVRDARARLGE
ncbi:MAG: hypothetical protein ACREX8_13275 [Gammaproteobacteria bacterium]